MDNRIITNYQLRISSPHLQEKSVQICVICEQKNHIN
jgi:hypothetical protein